MKMTKQILYAAFFSLFAGLFISTSSAQCPSGMISYWKLQESAGPNYEDSFGTYDATVSASAPSQVAGVSGKAQYFNGSSGLSLGNHTVYDWNGSQDFSIELWVKFNTIGETRVFIGRDAAAGSIHWWIGQDATGKIRWFMRDSNGNTSDISSDATYNTNQWVHIVAVSEWNGTSKINTLYVNNTPKTLSVDFAGNFNTDTYMTLGYLRENNITNSYMYTGGIDEVALYDEALSASDVAEHYNNTRLYQIGYCDGNSPVFLSTPRTHATVGQQYNYDVDASGNPLPTYTLIESPASMSIDETTGVISWTPASTSENGHVVVRATNTSGTADQEFNIYLADQPECRSGLITYWDFNSATTPINDNISGYQLTGTSPSLTTGLIDGALLFDGVNDSLNMADVPFIDFDVDGDKNFSFEVWMKSSASPSLNMVLIGRDNSQASTPGNVTQYWLGVQTDGSAALSLRDYGGTTGVISGGSVLDGDWHHIVATYNAVTDAMKLYVDKILVDEATQAFSNFGCSEELNIGSLNTTGAQFWYQGAMDELSIYSTELTAAHVTSNYNAAMAGNGACTYNYAPLITTSPVTEVDEDSEYSYEIMASDIDAGDVISISAITKPQWLNFVFTSGNTSATLTGTPTNAEVGSHPVTLRVSDGETNVDQSFTVEVINTNDPPEITSDPGTIALEDVLYVYKVTATDEDEGDVLTITATVYPDWLEFRNDSLVGTPSPADAGFHDVTISVTDGTATVTESFQIEARSTNDAPEFTSFPVTAADDYEPYLYKLTATDEDGDALTYTLIAGPEWLSLSTDTLSGTPTWIDADSVYNVIIEVTDGYVTDEQNFNITVGNTNDPPVFTSTPATTITAGENYSYQATATDVDEDDELTFTTEYLPDWLEFIASTNMIVGSPSNSDAGANIVILKVSDGRDDVIQNFTITVSGNTAINSLLTNEIKVYPNPADNVLNIQLEQEGIANIIVYDLAGNIHKQESMTFDSANNFSMNISDLSKGVYIYKVVLEEETLIGRFAKR